MSQALYDGIRTLILSARQTVARGVDLLQGAELAQYGKEILRDLAGRLTAEFGKGFSRSNLEYMRRFYLVYPDRSSRIIPQTASGKSSTPNESGTIQAHHRWVPSTMQASFKPRLKIR